MYVPDHRHVTVSQWWGKGRYKQKYKCNGGSIRYFMEVSTENSVGAKLGVIIRSHLRKQGQEKLERRDVAFAES